MKAPFETITLPQSEAEAFLAGFDRPGHSALVAGPWFHSEFDELVDMFEDPHALIARARNLDARDWVVRESEHGQQSDAGLHELFQAVLGPLTAAPRDGASDAEKHIHAARRTFAEEDGQPEFIKDLEETLDDAARLMSGTDHDPMPEVLEIVGRLQAAGDQARTLDDNLRTIQTLGRFFMSDTVATATGASGVIDAMFRPADAEPPEPSSEDGTLFRSSDSVSETVIAILPVDDPWAALAYMQQGSYMHHVVPLLSVARDLAKRYGAVPVMATSDSIGLQVAKPPRGSGDEIARAFQALGATTINDIETAAAAPHLLDTNEWTVWWD